MSKLNLPDDIEIIIMDDESDPPLKVSENFSTPNPYFLKNLHIYRTGNKAPWTQALARNQSIEKAKGSMLLFTDIDHFFPRETIIAARNFTGDKMMFKRQFGILDENGQMIQNKKVLKIYGLKHNRLKRGRHNNSFAIRKSVYKKLGGYKKRYWENRFHRSGDSSFYSRYERMARKGIFKPSVTDHLIYTFPGSNGDPLGLFHSLSRQEDPIKEDKCRT
jgi:hypothetical protein